MAQIYQLDDYRSVSEDSADGPSWPWGVRDQTQFADTEPQRFPSVREQVPVWTEGRSNKEIGIESLYPQIEGLSPTPFTHALRNLKTASDLLDEALEALAAREMVAADNSMMHFNAILPELFCSRSIGDGFGMVINSVIIAIRNRGGMPLLREHVEGLRACIKRLFRYPLMSTTDALAEIERLSAQGLDPDLPELDPLADVPE